MTIELIGYIAAVLTTFAWLPQIFKVVQSKNTRDISLPTTAMLFIGVTLWIAYGVFVNSWPIIIANILASIFILILLLFKLKYK